MSDNNTGLNYGLYIGKAPNLTFKQFDNLSAGSLARYWCGERLMAINETKKGIDIYYADNGTGNRVGNVLRNRYLKSESKKNWKVYNTVEMYVVYIRQPENIEFVKKHWQRFFFKKENEKEILFKGHDKEYESESVKVKKNDKK